MNLGSRIKELRIEQGLSQEELAAKLHVTRQTVSNWENNKNYPDLTTLVEITELFRVSFDEIVKEDPAFVRETDENKKRVQRGRRWMILLTAVILSLCTVILGLVMTADKVIGAMVWVGDDGANAPEAKSIVVEYVEGEDGTLDLSCNHPEMQAVAIMREMKDGEYYRGYSYMDELLGGGFIKYAGPDSEIDITVYFDGSKELFAKGYKIYERNDGSLYVKSVKGMADYCLVDGMCTYMDIKDRNRNLSRINLTYSAIEK